MGALLAFTATPLMVLPIRPLAFRSSRSVLGHTVSQYSQKSEAQPRRITSNVKYNLHLLKLFKEFQKKEATTPRPTTSYRRKKLETQEVPDDVDEYEDPTTRLYYTIDGFELARPVLLVDGYNMCGFWPKLKKHFARGHLEEARHKLMEELVTFTCLKGVKVVVVFDATLSGLSTHKEAFCKLASGHGHGKLLQIGGFTTKGAYIWNCKTLIAEIKDAKKELQELLHDDSVYSVKGKLLEHNLDREVVDALQALKQQLSQLEQS